jgi:hypothetical protein
MDQTKWTANVAKAGEAQQGRGPEAGSEIFPKSLRKTLSNYL